MLKSALLLLGVGSIIDAEDPTVPGGSLEDTSDGGPKDSGHD